MNISSSSTAFKPLKRYCVLTLIFQLKEEEKLDFFIKIGVCLSCNDVSSKFIGMKQELNMTTEIYFSNLIVLCFLWKIMWGLLSLMFLLFYYIVNHFLLPKTGFGNNNWMKHIWSLVHNHVPTKFVTAWSAQSWPKDINFQVYFPFLVITVWVILFSRLSWNILDLLTEQFTHACKET